MTRTKQTNRKGKRQKKLSQTVSASSSSKLIQADFADAKSRQTAYDAEIDIIYRVENILGTQQPFTTEEDQRKLMKFTSSIKEIVNQKTARLGSSHPETLNAINIQALDPKLALDSSEVMYRNNLLLCSTFEAVGTGEVQSTIQYGVCRITAENNLACVLGKKNAPGGLSEASNLLSDALLVNNEINGTENELTHIIYHNHGNISRLSGDHKSAAKYYEKALAERKKSLVVFDEYQVLDTQKSLAASLYSAGSYIESEILYREILPILQNLHGISNYATLKCQKLLVNTLIQQDKVIEAENILHEILNLLQSLPSQLVTPPHIQYIQRIESQIADLMYKKKNYVGAEKMYLRALPSNKENVYDGLARTLIQLGKFSEVFDMYRSVLERRQINFGPAHPATLHAICIFADLYVRSNQLNDGLQYYLRALLTYERELGENYLTFSVIDNIGKIYEKMNNLLESEKYFSRALTGMEQSLGADHVVTIKTVRNLSQVYKKLNKSTEAEILLTRVLKSSEVTKGMKNIETIRIVSSIAILLKKQGKLNESEIMYKRALEGYEDSTGINSKDTLSTYNNLGILYKAKNEIELAKDMYDKALAGRLLLLGTDHADTLCTMNNIAVLLSDQENYIEAEKLYEKVFLGFSKIFGSEHTETKRAKNNLALLQKKKKTSSLESNFDLSKEIEISKFSKDNKSEEQTVEFVKETFSLNQPAKMKKSKEKNRERESDWITNLKKKMKN